MSAPCGCPTGPGHAITDPARHAAWHDLVEQQGGPSGAVNAVTLQEACGHRRHDVDQELLRQGREARDQAITAVEASAPASVKQAVDRLITEHASTGEPFSANTLRAQLPHRIGPWQGAAA